MFRAKDVHTRYQEKQKRAIDVLNYLKRMDGCYPNVYIAYRILMTIPVTVASAERSFSS